MMVKDLAAIYAKGKECKVKGYRDKTGIGKKSIIKKIFLNKNYSQNCLSSYLN